MICMSRITDPECHSVNEKAGCGIWIGPLRGESVSESVLFVGADTQDLCHQNVPLIMTAMATTVSSPFRLLS
jgi:hypothetical protein